MNAKITVLRQSGFTLIELLAVILIISILMSLTFTAVNSVRESARRTAAKRDLLQIVSAVNAYYTEYGVYPIRPPEDGVGSEVSFTIDNSDLFYTLRAVREGVNAEGLLNPKSIRFIDVPDAANPDFPRRGLSKGIWYDPWGPQPGKPESGVYHIRIDGAYTNVVSDPYPGDSGASSSKGGGWLGWLGYGSGSASSPASNPASNSVIHSGVIAWSLARTGIQTLDLRDQVLSWK